MEELPDIDEGCLRTKLTELRSQLNHKKGPFAAKHRLELEQKMKAIESQIRKMQKMSSDKNLEYNQLEASVSSEEYDKVSSERIKLRSDIEKELFGTHISKMIMQEAEKFDSELEVPEKVVLQGFDPDIGIKM